MSAPEIGGGPAVFAAEPPINQTACKPGSVEREADASRVTAIPLRRRLPGAWSNLPGRRPGQGLDRLPLARRPIAAVPIRSCSRWGLPCRLRCRKTRCALTAPFHPCPGHTQRAVAVCSLWHCPWGLRRFRGDTPPDVIRHRLSVEPGLSSPATFRW